MRDQPESPSDRGEYPNEEPIDRRESPVERDDDSFFPFFVPYGWPAWSSGEWSDQTSTEEYGRTQPVAGDSVGEDDTWLDEGLITLLLVGGVALFLFPEPATSALGVLLIFAGAMLWLIDWTR